LIFNADLEKKMLRLKNKLYKRKEKNNKKNIRGKTILLAVRRQSVKIKMTNPGKHFSANKNVSIIYSLLHDYFGRLCDVEIMRLLSCSFKSGSWVGGGGGWRLYWNFVTNNIDLKEDLGYNQQIFQNIALVAGKIYRLFYSLLARWQNGKQLFILVTYCYNFTPSACIHSQNTCDISTLETYYLNFIASQIRKSRCSVLGLYICRQRHWNKLCSILPPSEYF